MKILITGAAGFAGTCIARSIRQSIEGVELFGIDNLMRKGAETNLDILRALGVHFAPLQRPSTCCAPGTLACPSSA